MMMIMMMIYLFIYLFEDTVSILNHIVSIQKNRKRIVNKQRYGKKRSWPNLSYYSVIGLEKLEKITKILRQSLSQPRFETSLPRILVTSAAA
jgi:hypothetical protein